MKLSIALLSLSILFFSTSCDKEKITMTCEDDCLFMLEEVEGTVVMMNCFERFAIKTADPDDPDDPDNSFVYGIPDDMADKFKSEGMEVRFSATYRENKLEPLLPDPGFDASTLFQCDLMKLADR